MNTLLLRARPLRAVMRARPLRAVMLYASLAVGLGTSTVAVAELSNDAIIGPGLRIRPAYDGANSNQTELVPVIRYFGEILFVRSTQGVLEGGARTELAPGLHIGAQLAYEPGRKASESRFLMDRGMPDLKIGASIGAQVEWDHKFGAMPVTLLARARQHSATERGAQLDFRLSAGVFKSGRFAAGVFTQATWANAKSTRSLYAITPQQAIASGLPAYTPGSGWLVSSLGLLWSFDVSEKWVAVGNLESRHLQGDSARSPITERKTNYAASAGLAYRF